MIATPSSKHLLHVVFKTHLDIGFTDFASNVIKRYIDEYIPEALALARELRQEGAADRFIWTVGSWLIWEYMERASAAGRRNIERSIAAGDIVWHGLPFTTHSEMMEPSLFTFGLSLSQRLDQRFGRHTIAAKMTDVPGHTRGIVPLLADAGIRFLHIGVNPACTPPSVPPLFVWRDESSRTQVMVMYHTDYGDTTCLRGLHDGLSICFTGDNHGPQNRQKMKRQYAALRRHHPHMTPIASTLDAYAMRLAVVEKQLPVVRREIGDTWIHGTGSDPAKLAGFRELCRLRVEWLVASQTPSAQVKFDRFSRELLMVPEHTWGLDNKTHLADERNYTAKAFSSVRGQPHYQKMERSWREQRDYLRRAVKALPSKSLQKTARESLKKLQPVPLRLTRRNGGEELTIRNKRLELSVDPITGGISHLYDRRTGYEWCDQRHQMFTLRYEAFGREHHRRFLDQYLRERPWWAVLDFGKKGVGRALKDHHVSSPTVTGFERAGSQRLLIELVGDCDACRRFGSPKTFTIQINLIDDEPHLHLVVQWFGKTATRVAEATWLSIRPRTAPRPLWRFNKLGTSIDPLDVISNGNRTLHGVWEAVNCRSGRRSLRLRTWDAGLVAPGTPGLLTFGNDQPAMTRGIHVNLHNSTFNTNFPLWYEDDARFRFDLMLK